MGRKCDLLLNSKEINIAAKKKRSCTEGATALRRLDPHDAHRARNVLTLLLTRLAITAAQLRLFLRAHRACNVLTLLLTRLAVAAAHVRIREKAARRDRGARLALPLVVIIALLDLLFVLQIARDEL